MASIPIDLERAALKQITVRVHAPKHVSWPFRLGVLLIRLGVKIAGLSYGGLEEIT